MLNHALEYHAKGFSVIPVRPDKRPFIKWEEYQSRQATPEEITQWWGHWPDAMIGIVTGELSGLLVIDCDNEAAYQKIQELLPDNFITCIAKTPRGYHVYFFYPKGQRIGNATGIIEGVDIRGEGGYIIAPPSVNGEGKAYAWLEGLSIDETAPASMPDAIFNILNNSIYKGLKNTSHNLSQQVTTSHKFLTKGNRDDDLFHVGNCLIKGGCEVNVARQVLELLADNSNPPFPKKDAEIKIQSALQRASRKEKNVARLVQDFIEVTNGHFVVTDVYMESQLVTKEEKHAAIVELKRQCEAGRIMPDGNRRGAYRTVDADCEEMNYLDAETNTVELRLPFNIHDRVVFFPGNIIVIAGSPNAGKTAFLINAIKENMRHLDIHYFNSEMGGAEFRKRLEKVEGMAFADWNFKAWERSDNFQDVIKPGPGKLNIIDFLEVHDEFYKVGGTLAEIHRKLRGALAIVAIQKNKGTDMGLGGFRTLEKPRLALAMDSGKLKIVKAKNWASPINPNGTEIEFKLVNGCEFIAQGIWK